MTNTKDGYGIHEQVLPMPSTTASLPSTKPQASPPPIDPFTENVKQRGTALLDATRFTLEEWSREADALVKSIHDETKPGGAADPATIGIAPWSALRATVERMMKEGDPAHTSGWIQRACLAWWDAMTSYQAQAGAPMKICYRAMAGYVLARHLFKLGETGGALRWAALAHLADRLGGYQGKGGAETVLTLGLGLAQESVEVLDQAATAALGKAKDNWKDARLFPEMCLTEAINHDRGGCFIAGTRSQSHSLCSPFLHRALPWALDEAQDSHTKGERLEWLTSYLVGTLSGARAQRGFNALGFACEHDVIVSQDPWHALPGGSTSMLIECKNWKYALNVAEVGYFLARMKYVGAGLGVIVAKSGITDAPSDDKEKNARAFLVGFCQRENAVCLVIARSDLERLGDGMSFRELLGAKYEEFTFGRKKSYA
jgi:hypothetical protein